MFRDHLSDHPGREETFDLQSFFRHAKHFCHFSQDMGNGCLDHCRMGQQNLLREREGSSMDAFMEMLLVKKGSGNLIPDRFQVLTKLEK